jgi:hypothetical protein
VCLPSSLITGPGDSGRPVVAQIRGPHSGGFPWCRVRVGAWGAAPSGASPPPLCGGSSRALCFLAVESHAMYRHS